MNVKYLIISILMLSIVGAGKVTSYAIGVNSHLLSFVPLSASYIDAKAEDISIGDRAEKVHKASIVRFGFGISDMINPMDRYLKNLQDKKWGLMADVYFFRIRSKNGNGIDFFSRFMYRSYTISDKMAIKTQNLLYYKNNYHAYSFDTGFRCIYGFYFLHELWQFYAGAAPRFVYYRGEFKKGKSGQKDKVLNFYSIGVIGCAGIEITIFSVFGIFAEYNIGYCPVGTKERNIEGHQVYTGITFRTTVR